VLAPELVQVLALVLGLALVLVLEPAQELALEWGPDSR